MPLSDDEIRQALDAGLTDKEIEQLDAEHASAPAGGVGRWPSRAGCERAGSRQATYRLARMKRSLLLKSRSLLLGVASLALVKTYWLLPPASLLDSVNVGKTIQHGYANLAGIGDPNWRDGMISGYQPRTEAGKMVPEAIGGAIKSLTDKTKALLEQHGHPALAASVDPALEVGSDVAQLLGTGALARGAVSDVAKSAIASDAEKQALLDAKLKANPDDFNTLKRAMDAKFKIEKGMIPWTRAWNYRNNSY